MLVNVVVCQEGEATVKSDGDKPRSKSQWLYLGDLCVVKTHQFSDITVEKMGHAFLSSCSEDEPKLQRLFPSAATATLDWHAHIFWRKCNIAIKFSQLIDRPATKDDK